MGSHTAKQLAAYLRALQQQRGDAPSAYSDKALLALWDQDVVAPTLAYYDQILAQHVRPGACVLDAAVGDGERTDVLLHHGDPGAILALDTAGDRLAVARAHISDPRVCFQHGNLRMLPIADDTFDVVSCAWAISTLNDPRAAVREFLRVVKPDGVVLYAFSSLPTGKIADRFHAIGDPLPRLLSTEERPVHHCTHSSITQFAGGLATVVTLAKCCRVEDVFLPCALGEEPITESLRDG